MDRRIIIKTPPDVMAAFKKDKRKVQGIKDCGTVLAQKMEEELEAGIVTVITEDLLYLMNVGSKKDNIESLDFILSYFTFLDNTLIDFLSMQQISINPDSDRQKADMLLALKSAQYVISHYEDETDVTKLTKLAADRFKGINPQRFYNNNKVGDMCEKFINLGLGNVKIEIEEDINKKEKVGE